MATIDTTATLVTASSGGGGGGTFLVSPSVGLMIWTLIAFAITLFLLRKLAFPRIAEALEKRRDDRFARLDADKNGSISRAEFDARHIF